MTVQQPDPVADDRFGVKCPKCGHVTYFTKARACGDHTVVVRRGTGADLDELLLACEVEGCPGKMTVRVDCRGYR